MKNVKKLNEEPAAFRELPDESLDAVAGGGDGNWNVSDPPSVGSDSQGNTTHWQDANGDVFHFECPKCGRLLHQGTQGLLFCDPCDDWFSPSIFGSAVRVEGWYGK